jgi:MEMO1 family protein
MSRIRKPAVAGLFYPDNPVKLKEMVDTLLSIAEPPVPVKDIFGIIVPHAGYVYSGLTASYAFNLLKGKNIKTVIILSPSHREFFPGLSLYDGDAFETPFGTVEIDKDLSDRLMEGSTEFIRSETGHINEHAVEVEIPFLQQILTKFKIVPVVMGDQKPRFVNELARRLADVYDEGILILASSDLSHYHSRKEAAGMDGLIEQRITNFEYEKLLVDLEVKHCEACGGGPIVALMKAAAERRFNKSLVLHRSDSGDVTGDTSEVVGYLSAVIYK